MKVFQNLIPQEIIYISVFQIPHESLLYHRAILRKDIYYGEVLLGVIYKPP